MLSFHLFRVNPAGLFPSGFPMKMLYASLFSFMRAGCPVNLNLRDLFVLIVRGEKYKL
jgi:hypothetical protein